MSDTTTDFSKLRFAKPDRIALPDVSIETNQIASNLRELVLVSENFTNLVREVGRIICRETECLAVWASQFNSQTGQLEVHNLTDQDESAVASVAGRQTAAPNRQRHANG